MKRTTRPALILLLAAIASACATIPKEAERGPINAVTVDRGYLVHQEPTTVTIEINLPRRTTFIKREFQAVWQREAIVRREWSAPVSLDPGHHKLILTVEPQSSHSEVTKTLLVPFYAFASGGIPKTLANGRLQWTMGNEETERVDIIVVLVTDSGETYRGHLTVDARPAKQPTP